MHQKIKKERRKTFDNIFLVARYASVGMSQRISITTSCWSHFAYMMGATYFSYKEGEGGILTPPLFLQILEQQQGLSCFFIYYKA